MTGVAPSSARRPWAAVGWGAACLALFVGVLRLLALTTEHDGAIRSAWEHGFGAQLYDKRSVVGTALDPVVAFVPVVLLGDHHGNTRDRPFEIQQRRAHVRGSRDADAIDVLQAEDR